MLLNIFFPSVVSAAYLVVHQSMPLLHTMSLPHPQCFRFNNTSMTWCKYDVLPKSLDGVLLIEEEGTFKQHRCQLNPPWHLQRLVSRQPRYSKPYNPLDGEPTYVYVVDTWIDTKHKEFGGRASQVFGNVYGVDNPHGTHVAGIIGASTYGVSKSVKIFGVQVLDDSGRGSWSTLIEALSFISSHASQRRTTSVVNLSIGGSPSRAVDMAIEQLYRQGIFVVAAAGNEGRNACDFSPSRAPYAYTVAASDRSDYFSDYSNWGTCVNITAPGTQILSTIPNNKQGYMTGTSMAAPVISGLVSVYLSKYPTAKPQQIRKFLDESATKNVLRDLYYTRDSLAYLPLQDQRCQATFLLQQLIKLN